MRILIIEDDIGIIELLKDEFKDNGFEVDSAHSAAAGLDYLQKTEPELMILDYGLQDMNGKEFISEIKKRGIPVPPFLVATGQGDEYVAVQMMKLGARDYIIKDSSFLIMIPEIVKKLCREIESEKQLKLANENLQKTEDRYRTLFDNTPTAIWEKDFSATKQYLESLKLKGVKDFNSYFMNNPDEVSYCLSLDRVISVNQTAVELYEAESKEDLIKNVSLTFCEEGISTLTEALVSLAEGKPEFQRESKQRKLTGEYFYAIIKSFVPDQENLTFGQVLVSVVDISAQKESERKLRESEANFRSFFNTIDDMIFVAEESGKIFFNNSAVKLKLGYSDEEVFGKNIINLHPDSLRVEAKRFLTELLSGKAKYCPLPLKKADNNLIPVETAIWYGKWNGEKCLFILSKDLSKEQEALSKFNKIFDNNPNPMAIYSIDDRKVIEVNQALVNISGYSKEELIGKTAQELEFIPEEDKLAEVQEVIKTTGKIRNAELKLRIKSGKLITGLFSVDIIESYGKLFQLIVMNDITGRKLSEEALKARIRIGNYSYSHSLEELLRFAIDETEKITESKIGFYHFVDEDQKNVKLQIWSSNTISAGCKMQGMELHYGIEKAGVWVECFYKKQPVIHNDYNGIPNKKGLPYGHVNVIREISIPVIRDNKVKAILGVGNKEVDYTMSDVEVASRLAELAWDIVERKRAEEALRDKEELYRLITENTADTIAVYGIDLKCIYVSPAITRMLGYSVEEFLSMRFENYIKADSLEIIRSLYQKEMEFEKTGIADPKRRRVLELEESTKYGNYVWVETSLSFIRNNQGDPINILAVSKDISERKQSEETLRKLSLAVEQSPSIVIITDTEGKIQYVNNKFTAITGYQLYEAIGKNPRILKSGDTSVEEYKNLWETISAGKEWHGEFHNRRKDGSLYWESATISPIIDNEGKTTHYIALKQDITLQKQIEKEREALIGQLLQSQKMESVGRLAGGVAHDFNNMLGVIYGHADLILESIKETDPFYKNISMIKNAAEKSANLTHQLLAFARKQPVAPKVIDLNDTISDMLKMLQRLIGEHITLAWIPGVDLWNVKIDPSQIDQILANLCVNARDAISGTGEIIIKTANREFDQSDIITHAGYLTGEYVQIEVRDNGCGMEEETLKLIFEPFFTTKEIGKGTGLGLATVYGIVQQNMGFIDVVSEVGQGTAFNIFLPRFISEDREHNAGEAIRMIRGDDELVLIVEDQAEILDMTVNLLQNAGYRAISASTPNEAIALLKEYKDELRLLVTDVIMPEMNGKELSELARSLNPDIKTLFMSGYTDDILAPQGIIQEEINFITKPFLMKEFVNKIAKILGKDT